MRSVPLPASPTDSTLLGNHQELRPGRIHRHCGRLIVPTALPEATPRCYTGSMVAVPHHATEHLTSWLATQLRDPALPTLLYGSVARGDAGPHSDIDVLQIVQRPAAAYRVGHVSVVAYPLQHLRALCRVGNLFVAHLACEGTPLWGDKALFKAVQDAYVPPASFDAHREAIRLTAMALDVDQTTWTRNPAGFVGLAAYLLRSEATVAAAERGDLIFAVSALATALDRPELTHILGRETPPTWATFRRARGALQAALGTSLCNRWGSLEALAVWQQRHNPNAAAHTMRLLVGEQVIPYETLGPASVL